MIDKPRNLPTLDLLVDGQRLPQRCARGLTSLRVHQQLSLPSVCELCFAGIDDAEVQALLKPGVHLSVAVRGAGTVLFDGCISATEVAYGSDRLITVAVRAYDALIALRNRQSARAFVGLTAADVVREIAADLGLPVQCDAPGPVWPRLLQTGSDFDLLADVTERCGLYFAVQDEILWLHTLQGRGEVLNLTLNDNLFEARFEANAHGTSRRIGTLGWNPWRGTDHSAEADNARSGRSAILDSVAGDIGGADSRALQGRPVQGEEQALALAQAELDARNAQALVLWGTAAGDARLRPAARVRVAGVAAHLTGEHVLTRVWHTFDVERGFQSEISTELPPPRPNPPGTLMTLGQVTRIDDPDRIGRVQVAMPAYGNIESDWLQVVAAGAGKGKGIVVQPDIGDRVLLLLDRADPAQAVVLGSLFGELGLPEEQGGLGKDASFCFVTPGGHRLRMDDGARSVRISGSAGSHLDMTPDHVTLHAAAPMTIEAPGQTLVIRAKFIDFERS